MFGSIPDHLSNLNHIASPPSAALNAEGEEAFWDFMHTDQLFDNFGVAPSPENHKPVGGLGGADVSAELAQAILDEAANGAPAAPAPTPAAAVAGPTKALNAATLESFIAAFANESANASAPINYRLPVPLPLPYNAIASSSAPTPAAMDTAALLPYNGANVESPGDDRPSGAKRLKSLGAGPVEIEEDKRRRNTEASARFRAKKKEREQAVEVRAKELEAQVAQLIAEKASLENENKLLKAIVLGGQGGLDPSAGQITLQQLSGAAATSKRKRDD